jgi:hypothetical protein
MDGVKDGIPSAPSQGAKVRKGLVEIDGHKVKRPRVQQAVPAGASCKQCAVQDEPGKKRRIQEVPPAGPSDSVDGKQKVDIDEEAARRRPPADGWDNIHF